ncbi:unnamed protein product [Urochloa decumbens]|uniref:Uncharacterized protein n=1 Tax=Urochloa decumbens TaxID=240449 RepID=A0ABC8WBE0_9POAL
MAPPRRLPAGSDSSSRVNTGDKETISDTRISDYCPTLSQEPAFSPNTNKSFNLRKSIAWNPAFFTEQGVLDNTELSLLTGSEFKPNASPTSGLAAGVVSPFCRSGRSATASVLKEFADNSHGKLPAKYEKQGRKLFSSVKTPQRVQQREPTVPAVSAIHEEASGSVKCKKFLPHPKISPSSSFGGSATTVAKPSALRMPSPSLGFFTQESAHLSHGNSAKRMGRCCVENTSSVVKPPRYKQPEDPKCGIHLTKPLSTNCTAVSNLVLPVIRESNPNTLVAPEKESSSTFITSTYSAKSGNASSQESPDVNCLLAVNVATVQPGNPAKNDAARNSTPAVCSDATHVERKDISKQIGPFTNSYPLKDVCPSTIEPVEDSSLKSTWPLTKPFLGGTSSPSSNFSQVCSSSDLTCQSKSESGSCEAIYLGNSYAGETPLAISLSEGESCIPGLDFSQGFDSHNHRNIECTTLMESVKSTVCVNQTPCRGSSKGQTPALADCNSDFGDSLCNEAKRASSKEPNADSGTELETNNASAVKQTPSLHQHNHSYRSTEPSPMKLEAPTHCVDRQHALSVEPNMEDKMALDTDKLSAPEGASQIENIKALDRSRANTILKDHLKDLVPFTEEWLAVMEARGQEVLEQKTGAVQNSPPDKTAPEPSPWSPVKRKAQDVGPFDCTKYSKSVRTSGTP